MPFVDLRNQTCRRSREDLVAHMRAFELDLRFSVGVWFLSPMSSRFHDAYGAHLSIEQRLEIAARLVPYGLGGIEAHYPNEINEANLDLWRAFSRDTGVRIVTVIPLLFYDSDFEFGSLSSPIPDVRKKAIERTAQALRFNKELDTDFMIVWAGIDGYENPFGQDFIAMRDRFAYGLAEALDAVPGVRVAFEPKPYEPRGHQIYGTTAEGVLLGMKTESLLGHADHRARLADGHAMVAMNPEIGHMQMAHEDLAYSFSLVLEYGRLAHVHLNSQPLGNYDQDLNVGVVSPEQFEAALYVLKMHGYRGWFGIDINPERMSAESAVRNSMDAIRAANDRVNGLDHEAILFATDHPDRARGWLEAYLIRARAAHPDRLGPLPELHRNA
ncbi:MAG: TIM barrel protein [Deltaproteobacteria bacterium]|nr:TIM barrel protein [Deltaproteobacteria bacterium]